MEHPASACAHKPDPKHDAVPGMAEKLLSKRKKQRLTGRIFCGVGGLLVNVEGLKMDPHRMGRIRETARDNRVCTKQVAEFVVHFGFRNRQIH